MQTAMSKLRKKWIVRLFGDDYRREEEVIKATTPEDAAEHFVEFDLDEQGLLDDGEVVRVVVRSEADDSFCVVDVHVCVSRSYQGRVDDEADDEQDQAAWRAARRDLDAPYYLEEGQ